MIAAATAADLAALSALMAGSELLQRYRVNERSALQSLTEAFEGGDLLLVHRDPRVGGFAWLSYAPRVLDRAAYLRLLLVAAGARNRGIGTQLLSEAEMRARECANHMYLLATSDNHAARRFYERHGYRCVGELPGLVWPDLDETLYHKPLRRVNDAAD